MKIEREMDWSPNRGVEVVPEPIERMAILNEIIGSVSQEIIVAHNKL